MCKLYAASYNKCMFVVCTYICYINQSLPTFLNPSRSEKIGKKCCGLCCRAACITRNFFKTQNPRLHIKSNLWWRAYGNWSDYLEGNSWWIKRIYFLWRWLPLPLPFQRYSGPCPDLFLRFGWFRGKPKVGFTEPIVGLTCGLFRLLLGFNLKK